jgi:hypothetical protein
LRRYPDILGFPFYEGITLALTSAGLYPLPKSSSVIPRLVEGVVTRSFICFFSVTYSNDIYEIFIVIDQINNAVIADPDSPEIFIAGQFSTACVPIPVKSTISSALFRPVENA